MENESIVVNLLHAKAPKAGSKGIVRQYHGWGCNSFCLRQLGPWVQILVAIVLLLMWSKNLPEIKLRFHLLDLFAGGAAATKVWNLAHI